MGWKLRTGLAGGVGALAAAAALLLSGSPVFAAGGIYGDDGSAPASSSGAASGAPSASSADLLALANSLLVRDVSVGGASLGWAAGLGGADVRFSMELAPVGGASTRVSLPVGSSVEGLQPSTTYQYRILAEDGAGHRAVGAYQVFSTAADPGGALPIGAVALPVGVPSLPVAVHALP